MSVEWIEIGPCRIACGDCLEILPTIPVSTVDTVITDPPYEITASGGGIGRSRRDLQLTEGFTDCGFSYDVLNAFDCWMCFGTLRQVPKLIEAAADRRWMLITWNKQNPCPLVNGNYLPDTEYIIHAWRNGRLFGEFEDKARYIVHPLGDKEHGEHPNEKPTTVMRKMIRLATAVGETVLDPYMGSGTTGVVAIREGRKFIGIEKEPRYFEIARKRLERAWQDKQSELPFEPEPQMVQRSLLDESINPQHEPASGRKGE